MKSACNGVGRGVWWLGLLGLVCLAAGSSPALVQSARGADTAGVGAGSGNKCWALLVGVEKYQRATPLQYTVNDVEQLAETLANRGAYRVSKIVETAPKDDARPLRATLLAELPKWLAERKAEDQIIVYFSGHGFRAPDGRLYLAPLDCDEKDPAATGLSVEWLRAELAKCKAQFKLLVIDACHAGSDKGASTVREVTAEDLAAPFEKTSGVFTLASCKAAEKSLIWDEKRQSLFSYWLNQGLRGHADRAGDGNVTVDELYEYLSDNVPHVAQKRFSMPQTPARVVGPDTTGVAMVIQPKPQTLTGLLDDMAEKLATAVQLRELKVVGVPEFTVDAKKPELELGRDFGALGRLCATKLAGRLAERSAEKFEVLEAEALQLALAEKGLTPRDLRTEKVKAVLVESAKMQTIVLGILRDRVGQDITLQCDLVGTDRSNRLGSAGGTARLSESEWAMTGRSVVVPPAVRMPHSDANGIVRKPTTGQIIGDLDGRSQGPHPFAGGQFPFPITIWGKLGDRREERNYFVRGNNCYVPLRKGETYEIWVKNSENEPVFLRLLVDGLNTLPEWVWVYPKEKKRVTVEAADGKWESRGAAQRVSLNDAQAWKVPANKQFAVCGFYSETGKNAKYREFKVVDAQDSLAERQQQFTEQLGMITAAFYTPATKGSRSVEDPNAGTGEGDEIKTITDQYGDERPGDLRVVVHIRYVAPETIERMQRETQSPAPAAQ